MCTCSMYLAYGKSSEIEFEAPGFDCVPARSQVQTCNYYKLCVSFSTEHLELVTREVYLPLISSHLQADSRVSGDKLMDLMHRLVGAVQVTKGFW